MSLNVYFKFVHIYIIYIYSICTMYMYKHIVFQIHTKNIEDLHMYITIYIASGKTKMHVII